jgi:hypothetical protein
MKPPGRSRRGSPADMIFADSSTDVLLNRRSSFTSYRLLFEYFQLETAMGNPAWDETPGLPLHPTS